MLTTLFVGILTVLTAVVSIPFNMFNLRQKGFLMSLTTTYYNKNAGFVKYFKSLNAVKDGTPRQLNLQTHPLLQSKS